MRTYVYALAAPPNLLFLDSCGGGPAIVAAIPISPPSVRLVVDAWQDPEAAIRVAVLRKRLWTVQCQTIAGVPPFQGGAAGLFGYDFAIASNAYRGRYATSSEPAASGRFVRVGCGLRPHSRASVDRLAGMGEERSAEPRLLQFAHGKRLACRQEGIFPRASKWPLKSILAVSHPLANLPGRLQQFQQTGVYLDAVRRAVEYIRAGDCFQVNLSQRLFIKRMSIRSNYTGGCVNANPLRSPAISISATS